MQRAVGLHVAERCQVELERSEAPGKSDLFIATEMLAGKNQQRVLEPRGVELVPHRVVDRGDLHPGHHRAESRVERLDVECARHAIPPIELKAPKPPSTQRLANPLRSGQTTLRMFFRILLS